ncbi:MAG: acyltransferase [Nakamurella sp.]
MIADATARPAGGRPPRDLSIQTLRGLACILVVAFHVGGGTTTTGLQLTADDPWSKLIASLVFLRMPLFALLSGYVYALRPLRSGYPQFIKGKARRLLVPLLFVGTAFALFQSVAPGTNTPFTDEVPWYLWHIIPIRHFWFLESIFWVFLLVAILDRYRLLDRLATVVSVIVLAIVADGVVPEGNGALGFRGALYLLPFFVSGLAAYRFDWRSAPRSLKVAVLVTAVVLTAVTQLEVWGVTDVAGPRYGAVGAVLGICLCLALLLTRWTARPLVYIGAFSFVIYLVHPIGTAGVRYAMDRIGLESIALNMVVGIIGGLAFGIVVELIARRFRVTRFLVLGQKYRTRPAVAGPPPNDASGPSSAAGPAGGARLSQDAGKAGANRGTAGSRQASAE